MQMAHDDEPANWRSADTRPELVCVWSVPSEQLESGQLRSEQAKKEQLESERKELPVWVSTICFYTLSMGNCALCILCILHSTDSLPVFQLALKCGQRQEFAWANRLFLEFELARANWAKTWPREVEKRRKRRRDPLRTISSFVLKLPQPFGPPLDRPMDCGWKSRAD